MGNCQAAEAATVVIQHPGNKIERIYWSVSAHEIMNSNPGHYVALVVTSPTMKTENGMPLKQLKLLRPDDTLLIGQFYRLVSFEDVLKEFNEKKCAKLGKMVKNSEGHGTEMKRKDLVRPDSSPVDKPENQNSIEEERELLGVGGNGGIRNRGVGRHYIGGGGQWKPALQSISETGT